MNNISLAFDTYMGVMSGTASAFIVDKNEALVLHSDIVIVCNEPSVSGGELPPLLCSVNYISNEVKSPGLRKNHELIFVSVIRHLTSHHDLDN